MFRVGALLQNALGGGHSRFPGVQLGGVVQRNGHSLKDGFSNVMQVVSRYYLNMGGYSCIGHKGMPKFFDQLGVKFANFCLRHWGGKGKIDPVDTSIAT